MTSKQQSIDGRLFQRATFFTISLHKWGIKRKADLSAVQTNVDKDLLGLSKTIIESKEYDAISTFLYETKRWCLDRCMSSYMQKGLFIVLLTEVEAFDKYLTEAQAKLRDDLVPAFLAVYDDQVDVARRLKNLYDEADYPSLESLPSMFSIDWSWTALKVPDNLPEDVKEREIEKMKNTVAAVQDEITATLRQAFAELVEHAVEKLKPGEVGKPKRIVNFTAQFEKFFETFASKNLMEDGELATVVEDARKLLEGLDPKSFKKDLGLKSRLVSSFEKIQKKVDTLVVEAPSRRKFIEEED